MNDTTTRLERPDKGRTGSAPSDENIDTVARLERAALHQRSQADRIADAITRVVCSGPALVTHALWFSVWILVNLDQVPGFAPFDPLPFSLLTMVVSLEAIFLSLFVLTSQTRLSQQADKRGHLDLQIDLLAEREMTMILRMVQLICGHLGLKVPATKEEIDELFKDTDVHKLFEKLDTTLPTA